MCVTTAFSVYHKCNQSKNHYFLGYVLGSHAGIDRSMMEEVIKQKIGLVCTCRRRQWTVLGKNQELNDIVYAVGIEMDARYKPQECKLIYTLFNKDPNTFGSGLWMKLIPSRVT